MKKLETVVVFLLICIGIPAILYALGRLALYNPGIITGFILGGMVVLWIGLSGILTVIVLAIIGDRRKGKK